MELNLERFYKLANHTYSINLEDPEEKACYINLTEGRGKTVINQLQRTIKMNTDQPTHQLFTGHIGCGKSTELSVLKENLKKEGFHVVSFQSDKNLGTDDVSVIDVMLAIAQQVSESLEREKISLKPEGLKGILDSANGLLNRKIEMSGKIRVPGIGELGMDSEGKVSVGVSIAQISAKIKDDNSLRFLLRENLAPQTQQFLRTINEELLKPAITVLKERNKKGLVVIIDNLDKLRDDNPRNPRLTQPEDLFVEHGKELTGLACHVIYTIPLTLTFSNHLSTLNGKYTAGPMILPMVRVKSKEGKVDPVAINLLRQVVLTRAFPDVNEQERLELIPKLFENQATLDRLCQVSGGHTRNLVKLLFSCLQEQDPPFSVVCVEKAIRSLTNDLVRPISNREWQLIQKARDGKTEKKDENYQNLFRNQYIFEYPGENDEDGWFDINPLLAESIEWKKILADSEKQD